MGKSVLMFAIAFCINPAWAIEDNLSPEQQGYCNYMTDAWNVPCKSIKKVKFTPPKTREIAIGCQGPGIRCGGKVYFYTRINASINSCTSARAETIKYDEEWIYSSKDGGIKIYWRDGSFLYEGQKSKYFHGFDIGTQSFKDSMGKDREWFTCEVARYVKQAGK